MNEELEKLIHNLQPSKQAEVRFFVQQILERLSEKCEEKKWVVQEGIYCACDGQCWGECPTTRNQALNEVKALIQEEKERL